jgi:hypothetical protein
MNRLELHLDNSRHSSALKAADESGCRLPVADWYM